MEKQYKIELEGDGSFGGTTVKINGKSASRITAVNLVINDQEQSLTLAFVLGSFIKDSGLKFRIVGEIEEIDEEVEQYLKDLLGE